MPMTHLSFLRGWHSKAIQQRPELNLYVADKRHPSLAGTYIAASTVYASLFKKSPSA